MNIKLDIYSPYSLDLDLCDLALLNYRKIDLKGKRFQSIEKVLVGVYSAILDTPATTWSVAMDTCFFNMETCVRSYVECFDNLA